MIYGPPGGGGVQEMLLEREQEGGLREQAPVLPGVGDAGLWGTSTNAACGTWRPAESIALTPKRQKK